MGSSRLKALTVKEIDKLTSVAPDVIKHRSLGGVPGFVLVHTPQNYVGFALVYRHGGKRKKLTLGSAKALSLADARRLASKYRSEIETGADPHGEKIKSRLTERHRERLDPETMWDRYIALHGKQLRTRTEKDRTFRRYILPVIKNIEVTDVSKSHSLKMLDPLIGAGKRRMADVVRQEGAAWFQWLVEREHVDRNPFAGLRKAQAGRVIRTRLLTDQELGMIWKAAEPESAMGSWVKLLILTGTRNMEARAARWSEFDLEGKIWTIPAERAKNGIEQHVPLSEAVINVLHEIPRFVDVDLLFPAKGKPNNPASGDQKVKDRIDARFREAAAKAGMGEPPNWRFHDFRRTIATGLQRLGFRPDIADQVIGHVGTTRTGAAAHYLHHDYAAEKRRALDAWSNNVMSAIAES